VDANINIIKREDFGGGQWKFFQQLSGLSVASPHVGVALLHLIPGFPLLSRRSSAINLSSTSIKAKKIRLNLINP
jgi:hypothetical protein